MFGRLGTLALIDILAGSCGAVMRELAAADVPAPAPAKPTHSSTSTCVRGCCRSDSIPLSLSKSEVQFGREIARGAESVVYAATLRGMSVVAKKPRLSTSDDLDRFHLELQLLSGLRHPNIALLVAARAHPPEYLFLFPLYENGNLSHALHVLDWRPSLQQALRIARQLATALQYLHREGIVHRDVKPSNILLDGTRGAHLSDFGLATYVRDLQKPSLQNWRSSGKPTGGFHKKNMVGTLLYMAPEILKKEVQSEKSDVYAFAITINELLTGVVPYTDHRTEAQAHTVLEMNYTEQQLSAAVSSGELRPTLAGPEVGAPPSLSSLIEQCWSNTPADRPSFDNIVERLSYIPDELSQAVEEDCARTVAEGSAAQVRFLNTESHFDWSASAAGQGSGAREYTAPVWFRQSGCEYCPTLSAGVFATQGGRATMEDTNFLMTRFKGDDHVHLFGVFDGHRGFEAAEFAASAIPIHLSTASTAPSPTEALSTAFIETDISFRRELDSLRRHRKGGGKDWHPGCTAATALLINDKLFVANAGDCRTILCRKGEAIELSKDHTANCVVERERIRKAGGHVEWRVDAWRVGAAALEVTRSIGDDDLKPAVTAEPEVEVVTLSADDEYLVMASDGLWETIRNEDVIAIIKETVKEPSMCAKRLATEAVERGSTDNITVIVAFLRPVSTFERIY